MPEQEPQEADAQRLADVRAGAGQSVKCSGTGYLIGPRLVLTCRHVLVEACAEHAERSGTSQGCPRCRMWPQLQVRIGRPADEADGDGPEPVRAGASLLWEHPSQDVALLGLDSPVPGAQKWAPVRWGQLVTGTTQRYSALGFPRLARYADKIRFPEVLAGEINQLSRDRDGFALDQDHGPRDDPRGTSPWVGVSGAAVFVGSWLVGVVTVDDRRSHNRLRAVPITRCMNDAQFRRLVADGSGVEPVPDPVELADLLQTRPVAARAATPGSLLAATAETVSFQGCTDHLQELVDWRDGGPAGTVAGGSAGVSVRLLTGEGGQGKTWLAHRFAADSRDAGWVAGFTAARAAGDAQQQVQAEQLAARLRACVEPVLMVCDYAEASPLFVEALLTALLDRAPARAVRVLLLARTSGAWWQALQDLVGEQAARIISLPTLGDDPPARRDSDQAAVRGLATGLKRLPESAVARAQPAPEQAPRSDAEWRRNHSVKRRALVLTAVVSVVALAVVLVLVQPHFRPSDGPSSGSTPKTSNESPSASAVEGTNKTKNLGLTAAVSDKSYRAILPLVNPQTEEQSLDEVVLLVTFSGPACAEVPSVLVYEIQTPIAVDSSGQIKQGAVSAESGQAQGYETPASGQINWGCGIDQLVLRFHPSGALLARQSTTSVIVDIPRRLNVTKMINGVAGHEISYAELPRMEQPPEGGYVTTDYVAFHAIAVTSAGSRINSCFLLAKSDYRPGSGARDCDAKIDGIPLFWMQKFGPHREFKGYERVD
ncbi:trypsin-like peptidase domain-containing protein [Actinomadura coerulea]|uniref:trypsin-like peptidase domain-containing protein n=1 Tax=Actinomadura coerulea TaxID=46159 RepID=UPI0034429F37